MRNYKKYPVLQPDKNGYICCCGESRAAWRQSKQEAVPATAGLDAAVKNDNKKMQHEKERKIVLVPNGGLANRMRAVNSMIEFTKAEKIKLHVIWISNRELNAPFAALFKPLPHAHATLAEGGTAASLLYNSPRKGNLYLSEIATRLLFDHRLFWRDVKEAKGNGSLEQFLKAGGKIFVESNYDFGNYDDKLATNFVPCDAVSTAVNEFTARHYAPRTIGIHIRRTDNIQSIKRSPLSFFIDAMQKELDENPGTKFYVASDDATEKETLRKKFGEKIITRDIECRRNKKEGIIRAAEDLYLLSRTAKIYGSYYSSFSEMAAALGGIKLIQPR